MKRAIFLDRDGTINEEVGYLDDLSLLKLIDGAAEAIRLINESGMLAVVITNQSGVARGRFSEEFLQTVHAKLASELAAQGARIDAFYYCPHHPTEGKGKHVRVCGCRKPAPGMLFQAATDLDIDLGSSFMVGDTLKDIAMARLAGVKAILVHTGYGKEQEAGEVKPDHVASDLLAAVLWIMGEGSR
ncbi:MAG: D-glycero-beta-D-manno-heptose 1,7-bisphosphate 7-phosphatase [Smithellaceae bacterium]|nr:D-glycero-beta-D-manno-heptose 1,7-bisphosphate 7-phosphatase [Smithellaceae bacterium]